MNKMATSKITNTYAEALFKQGLNLYKNEPENPEVFYSLVADFQKVLDLIVDVPTLKNFLLNPLNSTTAKKEVLEKCFQSTIGSTTMNFLYLLVDKKRINLIESIGKTFLEKAFEYLYVLVVEVRAASQLTSTQEKALRNKLQTLVGPSFREPFVLYPNICLSLSIDPTILGGLLIKIGSKVIDLSLQGELQGLRKELKLN